MIDVVSKGFFSFVQILTQVPSTYLKQWLRVVQKKEVSVLDSTFSIYIQASVLNWTRCLGQHAQKQSSTIPRPHLHMFRLSHLHLLLILRQLLKTETWLCHGHNGVIYMEESDFFSFS